MHTLPPTTAVNWGLYRGRVRDHVVQRLQCGPDIGQGRGYFLGNVPTGCDDVLEVLNLLGESIESGGLFSCNLANLSLDCPQTSGQFTLSHNQYFLYLGQLFQDGVLFFLSKILKLGRQQDDGLRQLIFVFVHSENVSEPVKEHNKLVWGI